MKYLRNAKCCFVYHYYYYYLVLLSFPRTPRAVYFASCAVEKCLPGTPTPSLSTSRISKDSFPLESSSWHAIYSINPPFDRSASSSGRKGETMRDNITPRSRSYPQSTSFGELYSVFLLDEFSGLPGIHSSISLVQRGAEVV